MPTLKPVLVIAFTVTIIFSFLYIAVHWHTLTVKVSKHSLPRASIQPHPYEPKPATSTDWTGIPIASNNPLYKPQVNTYPDQFCLPILQFTNFTAQLHQHYEEWIPKLGFNNLLDCIVQNNIKLKQIQLEQLGVTLAKFAKLYPPKYVVQVSARNILDYSPFYGAIWGIINEQPQMTVSELLNFIDEEICYFRDGPYGRTWVACIHGVGVGLGDVLDLDTALQFCDHKHDSDWSFLCAAGVYSRTIDDSAKEWAPCDELPFAAACFKVRSQMWKLLEKLQQIQPCYRRDHPFTEEALRGCVWAHAYSLHMHPLPYADRFCQQYLSSPEGSQQLYLTCLDGYFHQTTFNRNPEICMTFSFPAAQDLCMYYAQLGFYFNPTITPWYNFPLLEIDQPQQQEQHQEQQ